MRVGIGYDVHPLVTGRKLVLGGVTIPFEKGLAGHSDADVLVHSIMDALLGAAGLKNIGFYFPNTDVKYKGISSLKLLSRVKELVEESGKRVGNIDATVVAERPMLSPYIDDMKRKISRTLGLSPEQVGVKATSSEGMGFTGRGEGIAAMAVALLEENKGRKVAGEGRSREAKPV